MFSDLLVTLLEYLKAIALWQPAHFRIDHLLPRAQYSPAMVENILKTHRAAWETAYLSELHRVLDALILVTYRRQPLNLSDLTSFLQILRDNHFTALHQLTCSSTSSASEQQHLRTMQFQIFTIFCEALQFWRLFLEPHAQLELESHPLNDPESLTKVAKILKPNSAESDSGKGSAALVIYQQQSPPSPLFTSDNKQLMHFIWHLFLKKKLVTSLQDQRKSKNTSGKSHQRQIQALEVAFDFEILGPQLLQLAESALKSSFPSNSNLGPFSNEASEEPSGGSGSQGGPFPQLSVSSVTAEMSAAGRVDDASVISDANAGHDLDASAFYQATVFQEVINVCIEAQCLVDDEIAYLDFASAAIAIAYQGRNELCSGLKEIWMNAQTFQDYPVIRLVNLLLENTFHEPLCLFRILTSVCANTELRAIVCNLLQQPVSLTCLVHRDDLRVRDDEAWRNKLDFSRLEDDHMRAEDVDDQTSSERSFEVSQWSKLDTTWDLADNSNVASLEGAEVLFDVDNRSTALRNLRIQQGLDEPFTIDMYAYRRGKEESKLPYGNRSARKAPIVPSHAELQQQVLDGGFGNEEFVGIAGFSQPAYRAKGTLIEFGDVCFVRWETQVTWWNIVLQEIASYALHRSVQQQQPNNQSNALRCAVLDLLHHLSGGDLRSRLYVQRMLDAKWVEVALTQALRWIGQEEHLAEITTLYRAQAPFHFDVGLFQVLLKDHLAPAELVGLDDVMRYEMHTSHHIFERAFSRDVLATAVSGTALEAIMSIGEQQLSVSFQRHMIQLLATHVQHHTEAVHTVFGDIQRCFYARTTQFSVFGAFFQDIQQRFGENNVAGGRSLGISPNTMSASHKRALRMDLLHLFSVLVEASETALHLRDISAEPVDITNKLQQRAVEHFEFLRALQTYLLAQIENVVADASTSSSSSPIAHDAQEAAEQGDRGHTERLVHLDTLLRLTRSVLLSLQKMQAYQQRHRDHVPLNIFSLPQSAPHQRSGNAQPLTSATYQLMTTLVRISCSVLSSQLLYQRTKRRAEQHVVEKATLTLKDLVTKSNLPKSESTSNSNKDDDKDDDQQDISGDVATFVSDSVLSGAALDAILSLFAASNHLLEDLIFLHHGAEGVIDQLLQMISGTVRPVDLFFGLGHVDGIVPAAPAVHLFASTPSAHHTYSVLASLLWATTLQATPYSVRPARAVRTSALSLLTTILSVIPPGDAMNSWFVSVLRIGHLSLLNRLIQQSLVKGNVDVHADDVLAWHFMSKLLDTHPITFAMLLGLEENLGKQNSGHIFRAASAPGNTRFSSIEMLGIAKAVPTVLNTAKDVYNTQPALLAAVLQFIKYAFVKAPLFPTIGKYALFVSHQLNFWKNVFEPLISDLPYEASSILAVVQSKDPEHLSYEKYEYNYVVQHCANDDDLLQCCSAITPQNLRTTERLIQDSCAKTEAIALALDILALERYGFLYELDPEIGLKITTEVNQLYTETNIKRRFQDWTKFYLKVTDPTDAIRSLQDLSSRYQWAIELFLWPHAYQHQRHRHRYGGADFLLLSSVSRRVVCQQYQQFLTQDVSTTSIAQWQETTRFHNALVTTNWMLSASVAELHLLDSFKAFLQMFTLPGSRIKEYVKRLKERSLAAASASSGVSADAKTSTPAKKLDFSRLEIPESPVVGSLSPMTNMPDASPISRQSSSFSGDKRSYEVANEILNTFVSKKTSSSGNDHEDHDHEEVLVRLTCVPTLLSTRAKAELLMVMLHHQLKAVAFKDADPSKSAVSSREIGSARMTQDKMEKTLHRMLLLYQSLFPVEEEIALTTQDPSVYLQVHHLNPHELLVHESVTLEALKMQIMTQCLTIMLMLLTSMQQYDGSNDSQSRQWGQRMQVFEIAFRCFVTILQKYGIEAVLSPGVLLASASSNVGSPVSGGPLHGSSSHASTSNDTSLRSSEVIYAAGRLALQLCYCALPQGVGLMRDVSTTDHRRWIALFGRLHFDDFLLTWLRSYEISVAAETQQRLAQASSSRSQNHGFMNGESNHSHPDQSLADLVSSQDGLKYFDLHAAGYLYHNHPASSTATTALGSVLDITCKCLNAQLLNIQEHRGFFDGLVSHLKDSLLLAQYQSLTTTLDVSFAGTVMAYDCGGGVSDPCHTFVRYLTLWESLLLGVKEQLDGQQKQQRYHDSSASSQRAATEEHWARHLCAFVLQYQTLFLYPVLSEEALRVSLQQIILVRALYRFLGVANDCLPFWWQQPQPHQPLQRRVYSSSQKGSSHRYSNMRSVSSKTSTVINYSLDPVGWIHHVLCERAKVWMARLCLVLSSASTASTSHNSSNNNSNSSSNATSSLGEDLRHIRVLSQCVVLRGDEERLLYLPADDDWNDVSSGGSTEHNVSTSSGTSSTSALHKGGKKTAGALSINHAQSPHVRFGADEVFSLKSDSASTSLSASGGFSSPVSSFPRSTFGSPSRNSNSASTPLSSTAGAASSASAQKPQPLHSILKRGGGNSEPSASPGVTTPGVLNPRDSSSASSTVEDVNAQQISTRAYVQEIEEHMLDTMHTLVCVLRQSLVAPFDDDGDEVTDSLEADRDGDKEARAAGVVVDMISRLEMEEEEIGVNENNVFAIRTYNVGQRVFYLASDHTVLANNSNSSANSGSNAPAQQVPLALYEGIVQQVLQHQQPQQLSNSDATSGATGASSVIYEVKLLSGLIDRVYPHQIVYLHPPLCPFHAPGDLHYRDLLNVPALLSLAALASHNQLNIHHTSANSNPHSYGSNSAVLGASFNSTLIQAVNAKLRAMAPNSGFLSHLTAGSSGSSGHSSSSLVSLTLSTAHLLRALSMVVASIHLLHVHHQRAFATAPAAVPGAPQVSFYCVCSVNVSDTMLSFVSRPADLWHLPISSSS